MYEDDLKHVEFVVYCVETYKGIKKINGNAAYQLLRDAGAIEYIDSNYEALHTFSDESIVWNIDEFLRNRI